MRQLRNRSLSLLIAVMLAIAFALPATVTAKDKYRLQVFSSSARTASVTSSAFDVGDAQSLVAYLTVTAGSGTTPTLDIKFQDSPDSGTTWFDIAGASFTQVTGSSSTQVVSASRKFSNLVRCVVTIGGTTPSFTFHVEVIAV